MSAILRSHKIGYHVYADNTQLYISFKCKQPLEAISKVNSCLSDIWWWMITNKLQINDSKAEFIVFRSLQLRCDLSGLSVNVGESQIMQSLKVRDLGVTFNQFLNLDFPLLEVCLPVYSFVDIDIIMPAYTAGFDTFHPLSCDVCQVLFVIE